MNWRSYLIMAVVVAWLLYVVWQLIGPDIRRWRKRRRLGGPLL